MLARGCLEAVYTADLIVLEQEGISLQTHATARGKAPKGMALKTLRLFAAEGGEVAGRNRITMSDSPDR